MSYVDKEKTLECIMFILSEAMVSRRNLDMIYKILYYADTLHLSRYGRLITGDRYIASKDFPIPAEMQNTLNQLIQDGSLNFPINYQIIKCDMGFFSETDIECLKEAIQFSRNKMERIDGTLLDDFVMNQKSLRSTKVGEEISLKSIIFLDLENGKEVWDYLSS